MDYDETWGISFSRIDEYFSSQTDVEKTDSCSFRYKGSGIKLKELPERHQFGMCTPQTRVEITGGADADEIHHRFFMRFLSAGG